MCTAHIKPSSEMVFDVKEFVYFVKEARDTEMNGILKCSIIKCQMNGSNTKYRGSLLREECHPDEMVEIQS